MLRFAKKEGGITPSEWSMEINCTYKGVELESSVSSMKRDASASGVMGFLATFNQEAYVSNGSPILLYSPRSVP
jgi:hypothetical protein